MNNFEGSNIIAQYPIKTLFEQNHHQNKKKCLSTKKKQSLTQKQLFKKALEEIVLNMQNRGSTI